MKKVVCIWFAISLAIFVVFGAKFNAQQYLVSVNEKLPSFLDIFQPLIDVCKRLSDINVVSVQSFFEATGNFFVAVWEVIIVPIRLAIFLFEVLYAFIPMEAFSL